VKLILRAGGVLRNGPEKTLVDDYIVRAQGLARGTGFIAVEEQGVELKGQYDRAAETRKLLSIVDASDELIILDERGKSPTSRMAAEQIYRALSILAKTPYHRD